MAGICRIIDRGSERVRKEEIDADVKTSISIDIEKERQMKDKL